MPLSRGTCHAKLGGMGHRTGWKAACYGGPSYPLGANRTGPWGMRMMGAHAAMRKGTRNIMAIERQVKPVAGR